MAADMNMNLNRGGIIGGFLGVAIVLAVYFLFMHTEGDQPGRGLTKLIILGAAAGGGAGNYLWTKLPGNEPY